MLPLAATDCASAQCHPGRGPRRGHRDGQCNSPGPATQSPSQHQWQLSRPGLQVTGLRLPTGHGGCRHGPLPTVTVLTESGLLAFSGPARLLTGGPGTVALSTLPSADSVTSRWLTTAQVRVSLSGTATNPIPKLIQNVNLSEK